MNDNEERTENIRRGQERASSEGEGATDQAGLPQQQRDDRGSPNRRSRGGWRNRNRRRYTEFNQIQYSSARGADRSDRQHRSWEDINSGKIIQTAQAAQQAGISKIHACRSEAGKGWKWEKQTRAPRKISVGIRRPEGEGRWCQYGVNVRMFMEARYFEGVAGHPGSPKVRSWNRYIASTQTPTVHRGPGRSSQFSVDEGRRVWRLKQLVIQGKIKRPREIGHWEPQPTVLSYEEERVIYGVISTRRGGGLYVGMTKTTVWERHLKRLNNEPRQEFERMLQKLDRTTVYSEWFIVPLEKVDRRRGELEQQWKERALKVEKFWVRTLRSAYNIRGWNIDHAPDTLKRDWRGKPKRRHKTDESKKTNGKAKKQADRRMQLAWVPSPPTSPPDAEMRGRRGRRRGKHNNVRKRSAKRQRRYLQADEAIRIRRALASLRQKKLATYLKKVREPMLRRMVTWMHTEGALSIARTERLQLRDTIWHAWYKAKHPERVQVKRSLMIATYAAPCIERLNIAKILAEDTVMQTVPGRAWQIVGKPLIAFNYQQPPYLSIANFTTVGRQQNVARVCRCGEAWCKPYADEHSGHVMSKDARIAGHFHPDLQELVEKGTKYRDAYAGLLPVPESRGPDTPEGRVTYMINCACDRLIDRAYEQHDIPKEDFQEWKQQVIAAVGKELHNLTAADREELMKANGTSRILEERRAELRRLQQAFVICEADKESGMYTFVCKKHYVELTEKELNNPTYTREGAGAARARAASNKLTTIFQHNKGKQACECKEYDWGTHPCLDDETRNTLYVRRLKADFEFCEKQGMIMQQKQGTTKLETERDETKEQFFVRIHRLSQQYGALKTHKEVPKMRYIAGGGRNSLDGPNKWLNRVLWNMKPDVDELMSKLTAKLEGELLAGWFAASPYHQSWIVKQSKEASRRVLDLNNDKRKRHAARRAEQKAQMTSLRGWLGQHRHQVATERQVQFSVWDFTTLYPNLEHQVIRELKTLVERIFTERGRAVGGTALMKVHLYQEGAEWMNGAATESMNRVDSATVKYFSTDRIFEILDYLLDNAYVTFGDQVYRQQLGVPIGFGASPMIANFTLAYREIRGIEQMVRMAQAPKGTMVRVPEGECQQTTQTQRQLGLLAAKLVRCCRNIDDILFIDLDEKEVKWAIDILYEPTKTGLQLNDECASWRSEEVHYLDMYVKWDRRGYFTDLYDKRTMLATQGRMSDVRRFPHVESTLTEGCKYNVLTGFLHRIHGVVTRRDLFVKRAAEGITRMWQHGYDKRQLLNTTRKFLRNHYIPTARWGHVFHRIGVEVEETHKKQLALAARRARQAQEEFFRRLDVEMTEDMETDMEEQEPTRMEAETTREAPQRAKRRLSHASEAKRQRTQ